MIKLRHSMFILLCILCFWMVFLTGCSQKEPISEANALAQSGVEIPNESTDMDSIETTDLLEDTLEADNVKDDIDTPSLNTSNLDEATIMNPLTGEVVAADDFHKRPLAVMFDNQYDARPQAGLIHADVAYEILAEGRITRYMGIFLSHMPEHIGPIRSARPYFIQKALEYNPFYVHVGGSMQALSDIRTYKMGDIDGLSSGAFHRESHKRIPHNMYSEADTLIGDGLARGYYESVDVEFLPFNDAFTVVLNSTPAKEIKFMYKAPTSSDKVGYYTTYKYDASSLTYLRYTNGHPHIDEDTEEQLYATNILVQYVTTKVLDNEGRLQLGLIGEGKGMYYTGGSGIPVTWQKSDARALTRFYDENNNEITLNPGKTWFQIMELNRKETIVVSK